MLSHLDYNIQNAKAMQKKELYLNFGASPGWVKYPPGVGGKNILNWNWV